MDFTDTRGMQLWSFETESGTATLRLAQLTDIPQLIALNKLCFPSMVENNVVWNKGHLRSHQRIFPEGQIVVEHQGEVVGAVASLIVHLGLDPYRAHTYAGITDGGYFHNHDPQGDTLYGADVYVHPDWRGAGIGHQLYEARRKLCQNYNLRRILAGGRIHNFVEYADAMTAEQYARAVETGAMKDLVLSFQLKEGFVVRGMLRNYIADPRSKNYATLIEWINPDHKPSESDESRKVRVAAVQYQVRRVNNFQDFADQVEYFIETAFEYRADFVVFPEFLTVQLLSQEKWKRLPSLEGMQQLADLEEAYIDLFSRAATKYGMYIIAGTHPIRRQGQLQNVCPFFFPDGRYVLQPKIHITPSEKRYWGIDGGSELHVIPTAKAKIGILICYDSEFPEAARYLADQGAEIIFVPYCTDDRQGYSRVRFCCQSRAIENQVYVVTAGIIGNLPSVPAMDIHYGQAAVYTPSDFEFPRDGIQAEADSNVETMLVSDLDIHDLYRCRAAGSVTPRLDRRSDLFEFRSSLSNDLLIYSPEDMEPIPPTPENDDDIEEV